MRQTCYGHSSQEYYRDFESFAVYHSNVCAVLSSTQHQVPSFVGAPTIQEPLCPVCATAGILSNRATAAILSCLFNCEAIAYKSSPLICLLGAGIRPGLSTAPP